MVQKKTVPGSIPEIVLLCSFCGRLRNDAGRWAQGDNSIEKSSYAYVSHGICPDCAEFQFPDEYGTFCREKKGGEVKISPES